LNKKGRKEKGPPFFDFYLLKIIFKAFLIIFNREKQKKRGGLFREFINFQGKTKKNYVVNT